MLGLKKVGNYSLFIHPRNELNQKAKFKMEKAIPPEFKWAFNIVTRKDTYQIEGDNIHQNKKEELFRKLVNKVSVGNIPYKIFLKELLANGFSELEAPSLLNQSITHTIRAADWAFVNEHGSGTAAGAVFTSTLFGIAKILVKNLRGTDNNTNLLQWFLSFFENSFSALRGFVQFKIYGDRCDDDRAENKYEEEFYRNKASGVFADLAYIFETRLNPFFLPVLSFVKDEIQNAIKPLLSLCNVLWWRIRMPQEINQSFATDIISLLINKPFSFLGLKKSKETLSKIDPDNLSFKYVKKRARDLIGLDPKKDKNISISSKLFKEIKTLIASADKNKKIKSSIKINKFISPFLGLYGFFVGLVAIPLNSLLKLFGKENKYLDSFSQTCFASQQIIYFFRLMLPEYLENKKINIDEKLGPKDKEELANFKDKRNTLYHMAKTICAMNIVSIFLKLFNFNQSRWVIRLIFDIYNEIADKGIPYYLSKRRSLLGRKFRLDNSELFDTCGIPKIKFSEEMLKPNHAMCLMGLLQR